MKMIDHNHFICHLILGTFTEYPFLFFKLAEYYSTNFTFAASRGFAAGVSSG